jgi:hypothetical protein
MQPQRRIGRLGGVAAWRKDIPGAKAPVFGCPIIVRAKARTYLRSKGNGNRKGQCGRCPVIGRTEARTYLRGKGRSNRKGGLVG